MTNEFLIANQPEDEAITFSLSEAFENYEALTTNTVSPLPLMVRVRLTCESSATSELVRIPSHNNSKIKKILRV